MSLYQRITTYLPLPLWHVLGLLSLALCLVWIVIAYHGEGGKIIATDFSPAKESEQSQQPIELLAMSPAAEKKWMEAVAQAEPVQKINLPPVAPPVQATLSVKEITPKVSKENLPTVPVVDPLPKTIKREKQQTEEKVKPLSVLTPSLKDKEEAFIREGLKKEEKKKELPMNKEIKAPAQRVSESPKKAQEHYTVQLLSSQNQSAIQALLDKNSAVKQLRMMVVQQQGQARYLLLYGSFSSREEASSAMARIPAQVVQGSPWIRSLGATHETK